MAKSQDDIAIQVLASYLFEFSFLAFCACTEIVADFNFIRGGLESVLSFLISRGLTDCRTPTSNPNIRRIKDTLTERLNWISDLRSQTINERLVKCSILCTHKRKRRLHLLLCNIREYNGQVSSHGFSIERFFVIKNKPEVVLRHFRDRRYVSTEQTNTRN